MGENSGGEKTPAQRHGAGTYQMLWDCKFCGTQKLLGLTHRHCPNCGAAQDPAWRYLPAEADMIAVEDHKFVGVDRICPACSQPNSAASHFCSACGADLSGAQQAVVQEGRELGTGIAETDTRRDVVKDQFDAEMARVRASAPPRRMFGLTSSQWIVGLVLVLLVLCVGAAIYALTYSKQAAGTVTAQTWERTITIEDFRPRTSADWDERVPGDAYNTTCRERQRGTERVQVGSREECRDQPKGDGSFERICQNVPIYQDQPVYDQWCTFTVDRWDFARTVKTEGQGTVPAPIWPLVALSTGTGRYGQEREGPREAIYRVSVRDAEGGSHTCRFDDEARWRPFSVGASVTLKLNIAGDADCDTLQLAQ